MHAKAGDAAPTVRRLAFTTLGANVATAVVGFAASIVIGRALGPEGRGNVAAFQIVPSICALIFAIGLPHAATYFTAVSPNGAVATVRRSAVLAGTAGALGTAVCVVCVWFYLGAQNSTAVRNAGIVFSSSVLFGPILGVLIHSLRSLNRTAAWNTLRILLDCSLVAAALVVVFVSKSYVAIALAQVAWLALLLPVAVLAWRRSAIDNYSPVTRRQLVNFGVPTMLATLPYFLNFRVDQLILLSLSGSRELGIYAVAVTWSAASLPIMNTVSHLTLPRLAGKTDDRDASAARFVRMSIALAGCTALALSALSPFAILTLFGPEFADSVSLAVGLSFATALLGITTTAEEVLRAYGDVHFPARAQIVGLALNVAMLFALIPLIGAWGAVIASGIAYAAVCTAVLGRIRTLTSTRTRDLCPGRAELHVLVALLHPRSVRLAPWLRSGRRPR